MKDKETSRGMARIRVFGLEIESKEKRAGWCGNRRDGQPEGKVSRIESRIDVLKTDLTTS